jgi:uncharacterized protein (TIGR02270 family)
MLRREVVDQFVEVACGLAQTRARWLNGYRFGLRDLRRLDERIEAHLDGLLVAPDTAEDTLNPLLEEQEPGAVTVGTMLHLFGRRGGMAKWLLQQHDANPRAPREIDAAFAWVPTSYLRGVANELLGSTEVRLQRIAVAAATAHRVVVDRAVEWFDHDDVPLASEAARHLGSMRIHSPLSRRVRESRSRQYWNAWASLFTRGASENVRQVLYALAVEPGEYADEARAVSLTALPVAEAHELLRVATEQPDGLRRRIEGCALIGAPRYVDWLIGLMRDPAQARVAGEAFCTITGVDLVHQELDGEPLFDEAEEDDRPETPLPATNDEDLLWPDADKVAKWWNSNQAQFRAHERYLCGALISTAHCRDVIRMRYQPQRAIAALHLGLHVRDLPVFDTTLPAWRQLAELDEVNPSAASERALER